MPKRIAWSIACVALLLWFTGLGFAQASAESAVRGNLAGSVVDPSSALVQGAKVTLSGPMGQRSAETDQEGRFLFQVLVPGFYSVKVEKQGFKSTDVKGVEVVTGRTSSISVKMEVGTSATTVEVTGGAITVDTESTAQASNLTDTFYQSVPMGRGVTGLFYAAPGVASGGGTGTANPSISGATGLENNYIADGVSITDGAFGGIGVYSRVYGSLSSGINLSFVKEVQVKTGGFEAQYGKSTGGIVQIVTKTGSNAFHGSVGGYFAPQQFEAQRLQQLRRGRPTRRLRSRPQGPFVLLRIVQPAVEQGLQPVCSVPQSFRSRYGRCGRAYADAPGQLFGTGPRIFVCGQANSQAERPPPVRGLCLRRPDLWR